MSKKIAAFFIFSTLILFFLNIVATASAMPAPGEKAPNFTLRDQNGKVHHLSDYKGKIVVLAFYPADFTKGCTLEAHVNTKYYPEYKKEGIMLLGISVQTPSSHKAFCEKEGIPYTLLADTKGKAASLYGVLGPGVSKFPERAWYSHPKEYSKIYAKDNPHPVNGLASRVTFIVGKDGKIAYVDPDVDKHLLSCAPDWLAWIRTHLKTE